MAIGTDSNTSSIELAEVASVLNAAFANFEYTRPLEFTAPAKIDIAAKRIRKATITTGTLEFSSARKRSETAEHNIVGYIYRLLGQPDLRFCTLPLVLPQGTSLQTLFEKYAVLVPIRGQKKYMTVINELWAARTPGTTFIWANAVVERLDAFELPCLCCYCDDLVQRIPIEFAV